MKPHPGPIFLIVVLALNSVSPDDLWKLLPEEKEVKSIKATGDPSSELVRQLLVDNSKRFKPWWKGGEYLLIERPSAMNIPGAMVERTPRERPLLLCNVSSAKVTSTYFSHLPNVTDFAV